MTENVWQGIFSQPGNRIDRIILELPPAEVVSFLAENPEEDPVFLIAGACLDLRRNGYPEKAEALMAAAKVRWPEFRWDVPETTIADFLQALPPVAVGALYALTTDLVYTAFEVASATARGQDYDLV